MTTKRMTEKEFLDKLSTKDCPSYSYSALLALELAKQHGAKFDPSPVELPELRIEPGFVTTDSKETGYYSCLKNSRRTTAGYTTLPTLEQANEIIRRCRLVSQLKKYITDRYLLSGNGRIVDITPHGVEPFYIARLLDMIDGRDVQSGEGEDMTNEC